MKFVVFDTETTGLPTMVGRPRTFADPLKYPQHYAGVFILSLAFAVQENDETTVEPTERYLRHPGIDPESGQAFQAHGITRAKIEEKGEDPATVLRDFLSNVDDSTCLVGHNVDFDVFVLAGNLARLGLRDEAARVISMPRVCTMRAGTPLCRIPSPRGDYKWPKLVELYTHLFGHPFEGAHNAACDVRAALDCFNRMCEIGAVLATK